MKRSSMLFSLFLISLLFSHSLFAQEVQFAKELKTKYAVPDAPAFNMLNQNALTILKPGSVKDIALGLANFLDVDNRITLPRSLAVEFSPGLLMYGKTLTLDEYRKRAGLYRLRISLATAKGDSSSTATNLAFGLRVTLNDDSDPRTNKEYLTAATKLAEKIQTLVDVRRKALGASATISEIENDQKLIAEKKELEDSFNAEWLEDKWNKNMSELAFAFRAASKDSLTKNLKLNKFTLWYTSAYGLDDWGQFLFGLNISTEKVPATNKFRASGSIASRFYMGTNDYKIYMELEASLMEESKADYFVNSGFELKVQDHLWAEFTAGIKQDNLINQSLLVTDFKLKYGL